MIKRWKTVLALKVPVFALRNKPAFSTVDIADRLHEIASELKVADAAINGLDIGDPEAFGLYLVLRRQIENIKAVRAEIHPCKA